VVTREQTRIGPHLLVKLIRVGQVCEIWEVEDSRKNRRAMKFIPAGKTHTKEEVSLLKHEYQVGQKLSHENLVEMYDFDTVAEGTYLILELVRRANLKQRIGTGTEQLAPIAETVIRGGAAALGHMHSHGWIHRDVKPDNFLVDDSGHVKLIDFALAQKKKGALGKLLSGKSKIQGTPSYMSPEQIRGQAVDERSDVYSYGCIVFEMLTGKPPYTGTSINDLLNRHLKARPPSPTVGQENVDPAMATLVQRMIELDQIKIFRHKPKPRPSTPQEEMN